MKIVLTKLKAINKEIIKLDKLSLNLNITSFSIITILLFLSVPYFLTSFSFQLCPAHLLLDVWIAERYEYANKIKATVPLLRTAGERLGKYEIEKRHAIDNENFERAKLKKQLQEEYRDSVYKALHIDELLEKGGVSLI